MNALLVFFRTVHYASAIFLFGGLVFSLFVAAPAFLSDRTARVERIASRFWKATCYGLVAAIVSGAGWLLAASALMSGLPIGDAMAGKTIGLILGSTLFGQVFAVRAGLLLALGTVLLVLSRTSNDLRRRGLGLAALVLAAGYLGSLAGSGHAVAGDESGNAARVVVDVAHVWAAGAWLGALPALVFMIGLERMQQESTSVLRRFSTLGVICVGVLTFSGGVNSWYQVGTFPALIGTDYGRLLLVKLVLFAAMLGFAAVNRGLSMQLEGKPAPTTLQRIRRNALCEIALGVGVIAIVAVLGALVPAVHEPVTWPFNHTLSFDHVKQSAWLQLAVATSGTIGCIAVIAFLAGALARPPRARIFAIAGACASLLMYGYLLVVPAHPTTYAVSTVTYSAEAIAAGSLTYMDSCSTCHGSDGRGRTELANSSTDEAMNLNDRVTERREGDLFWSITQGVPPTTMPGFGEQLAEVEIWNLIQFLDAQAAAHNAQFLSERLKPVRPVPAPEFTFEFPGGPQESLRQQRGKRIPLLVFYTLPTSLPRLRELAALAGTYAQAGAVVIAVPLSASAGATPPDLPGSGGQILAFTSLAVGSTYALFARQVNDEPATAVQHVEYLVDRFGSIRAREIGIPAATSVWSEQMLHQLDVLVHEPPRPPIQWGHRH